MTLSGRGLWCRRLAERSWRQRLRRWLCGSGAALWCGLEWAATVAAERFVGHTGRAAMDARVKFDCWIHGR